MHGEKELNIFFKSLNEYDPCIKFTYESNKENVVFLLIKITFGNGKVVADMYVEPTDGQQYLHCLSTNSVSQ